MPLEYTIVPTPEGPAAAVALSRGASMLLDPDAGERFVGHAMAVNNKGYVTTQYQGRTQFVHRLICPPGPGLEVDHINGNRRDNRRCNLRAVTHGLNLLAARTRRGRCVYRGVNAHGARFQARLEWRRRRYYVGLYGSALVAALARDDGVVRITGHAEGLNFAHAVAPHAVRALLESFGADRFGVIFVRRTDGAVRRMICRGAPVQRADLDRLRFDPARRNLWPVWDLREKDYRFIPLEGILCITHLRKRYRLTLCEA